jgi:hypothetical protein
LTWPYHCSLFFSVLSMSYPHLTCLWAVHISHVYELSTSHMLKQRNSAMTYK